MNGLALALALILPAPEPVRDRVDLIELNHVFYDNGKHCLDQLIFYTWNGRQSEHDVKAWRLTKRDQRPTRDFRLGGWAMMFCDGGPIREVRSTAFSETWSQYDVERHARDRLPQECRVGLTGERP